MYIFCIRRILTCSTKYNRSPLRHFLVSLLFHHFENQSLKSQLLLWIKTYIIYGHPLNKCQSGPHRIPCGASVSRLGLCFISSPCLFPLSVSLSVQILLPPSTRPFIRLFPWRSLGLRGSPSECEFLWSRASSVRAFV